MLFAYFLIFFFLCFFVPSIRVYYRTKKNPLVFKKSESAHDLIGFYMKIIILSVLLSTALSFFTDFHITELLTFKYQKEMGTFLLVFALMWIIIAQAQMSNSWRIGIDESERTELVTWGVFRYSRNPIFLGIMIALFGMLILEFNFLNLIYFVLTFVLVNVQVRLEEDYLLKTHSEVYLSYKNKTPRWLML